MSTICIQWLLQDDAIQEHPGTQFSKRTHYQHEGMSTILHIKVLAACSDVILQHDAIQEHQGTHQQREGISTIFHIKVLAASGSSDYFNNMMQWRRNASVAWGNEQMTGITKFSNSKKSSSYSRMREWIWWWLSSRNKGLSRYQHNPHNHQGTTHQQGDGMSTSLQQLFQHAAIQEHLGTYQQHDGMSTIFHRLIWQQSMSTSCCKEDN